MANHTKFAGVLYLCQNGLTSAKPNGGMEIASQGVVCTVSNSFTREARNNVAKPMKVNALEGALVEAFSDKFPRFAAVRQRT